ncbi:SLATT domain-containing protein [Cronobacter turicensis]
MKIFFQTAVLDIKKAFRWFFSLDPVEREVQDPKVKLLNSMRVTSKCRFNRAESLKNISFYSFLTTTILSLGLIFIPLFQITGRDMHYSANALTVIQIFLAVSVLVYSVVIATSKYELRASLLDECGVKIKELIRRLRVDIFEPDTERDTVDLNKYHKMYNKVTCSCENHKRVDYLFATLESPSDFNITGIVRLWKFVKGYAIGFLPYIIPTFLIVCEVLFISDIIGMTRIFTTYFN